MAIDPFAPEQPATDPWAPSTPSQTTTPQEAPVTVADQPRDRFSVKLTLKAAGGHDAEWLTPYVSGATADECARNILDLLVAFKNHGVIEAVSGAANFTRQQYKGQAGGGNGGGRQQSHQRQAPQSNSTPPGVEPKNCKHGPMVYKTGQNRWGKPYQAFFCPTEKGDPNKCDPIFM